MLHGPRTPSRLKEQTRPLLKHKGWHDRGVLLLLFEPMWTRHEGTGPGWGHPMGLTGEGGGGLWHAQVSRMIGPAMLLQAVSQKPSCFVHSIHQNADPGSMPCSIPPLNQLLQQSYPNRLNWYFSHLGNWSPWRWGHGPKGSVTCSQALSHAVPSPTCSLRG